MNQNEKKEVMGKFAKKLENAIKREVSNKILRSSKSSGSSFRYYSL